MIGTFNIEKEIIENIPIVETVDMMATDTLPKLDGLLVSWWPPSKDKKLFIRQAELMSNYANKKVPIFIHDKQMTMTYKEFNWLRKFNTYFFEPAINGRKGFSFLPGWVNLLEYNILPDEMVEIKIGYSGDLSNKLASFEKYYVSYIENFPRIPMLYNSYGITPNKVKEYKDKGLENTTELFWNSIGFTIAIGTIKDYRIGYLDPIALKVMMYGCMPLLPIEHRFYCNMFKDTIVENINDIALLTGKTGDRLRRILIVDVYDRIKKYYPEFTLEYTMDKIKGIIGG